MKEILYLILLNIFLFKIQNNENFIILNNLKNINKTINNNINNSLTIDLIQNEFNIFSNISNKINNYLNLLNNKLEFESFNQKFSNSFNLNNDFSKEFILQSQNFIENDTCFFYHIFIMKNLYNNKNFFLFCINKKANNILLFNITDSNSLIFHSKINLNLNLKSENNIKISFTFFNEENIILIYSDSNIYIINININVLGKDIYIPMTKNFYLNRNITNSEIIIFDSIIYHMNKYLIIAFRNEINIYLLKKEKIQIKTNFILENNIDNIIIKEGFILLLTNDNKKITFLSLLGGNTILLTCDFYYKLKNYYYDNNNEFLYSIDENGRLIINYINININKIFKNECTPIYKYDLPKFIMKNNIFNFIYVKRELYFWSKNYIVFINKDFMLEEYFINLEKNFYIFNSDDKNILIGQNSNYLNIYKINDYLNKPIKKQKQKKKNNDENVNCNGNLICILLFNTYTNNKYITRLLYIICILLITGVVVYINKKKKEENLKFKEIEEKNEKQNKENNEKINDLMNQIKKLGNFQPYKDYKNSKENEKNYEEDDFEELEEFEEDEDDELKEYHRYMRDIIRNKKNNKIKEKYDEQRSKKK